ncbi:hypothetical protein D3C77_517830 [compost metagenome]
MLRKCSGSACDVANECQGMNHRIGQRLDLVSPPLHPRSDHGLQSRAWIAVGVDLVNQSVMDVAAEHDVVWGLRQDSREFLIAPWPFGLSRHDVREIPIIAVVVTIILE